MQIAEAMAHTTADARPEHRGSVEDAARSLLVTLGVQGVRDRVRLRVSDDCLPAMHELLVDSDVVWVGAMEHAGWRSAWLVQPWSLV